MATRKRKGLGSKLTKKGGQLALERDEYAGVGTDSIPIQLFTPEKSVKPLGVHTINLHVARIGALGAEVGNGDAAASAERALLYRVIEETAIELAAEIADLNDVSNQHTRRRLCGLRNRLKAALKVRELEHLRY